MTRVESEDSPPLGWGLEGGPSMSAAPSLLGPHSVFIHFLCIDRAVLSTALLKRLRRVAPANSPAWLSSLCFPLGLLPQPLVAGECFPFRHFVVFGVQAYRYWWGSVHHHLWPYPSLPFPDLPPLPSPRDSVSIQGSDLLPVQAPQCWVNWKLGQDWEAGGEPPP